MDKSVFQNSAMLQSLAFGLSFLQRMDMKPVVVMGLSRSEVEEEVLAESTSNIRANLVERSQALTELLQQQSATVIPFFSAEALLLQQDPPNGSRSAYLVTITTHSRITTAGLFSEFFLIHFEDK